MSGQNIVSNIKMDEPLPPYKCRSQNVLYENVYGKIILTCAIDKEHITIYDKDIKGNSLKGKKTHRPYILCDANNFANCVDKIKCPLELICIPFVQTKLVFDDDSLKFAVEWEYDIQPLIERFCTTRDLICKHYSVPKEDVLCLVREDVRLIKDKNVKKASFHYIVNNTRISYDVMKSSILHFGIGKNSPFDDAIYKLNSGLYPMFSHRKRVVNTQTTEEVSRLMPFGEKGFIPIDEINITDYCPSYIQKEFIDYDEKLKELLNIKNEIIKQPKYEFIDEDAEEEKECNEFYKKLDLGEIIARLKSHRAETYDDCIKAMWAIMNICDIKAIRLPECRALCDQFCALNTDKYNDIWCDNWVSQNYNKRRTDGNIVKAKHLLDMLKEDDPEYYDDKFSKKEELMRYDEFKKIWEKTHLKILYPPMIVSVTSNDEYILQSISEAFKSHQHERCLVKKEDKRRKENQIYWKEVSFIDEWYKDHKMRNYERYVFKPPPLCCNSCEFNTWRNFDIANEPLVKTKRNYWQEYYNYAVNLFGKKEYADFIFARYAYRLQNPGNRTFVCCIYYGEERTGKNAFLDPIYNIFGSKYVTRLGDAADIYKEHSLLEKDKLLLLVNEAAGVTNFKNADNLKNRITEPDLWVNPKGVQGYKIDNLCDYDMTTNNQNVVKLSDDSKDRWFQVETKTYYKGNDEFFKDYRTNIQFNEVAHRQIYEALMNFDVNKVITTGNFQSSKPSTEIEEEVKLQNRDKILWFLQYITEKHFENKDNVNGNIVRYKNMDFFTKWRNWCENAHFNSEYNIISFGARLSTIIKNKLNLNGKCCIKKDTSNSITTVYYNSLREYFIELNNAKTKQVMSKKT